AATGRVTNIAVVPSTNLIFAATASSGLWESTDGGNTWAPKTDSLGVTVGAIAVVDRTALTGNSTIYVSTSGGLLKSTDSGQTFAQIATPFGAVDRMVVAKDITKDPTDPNLDILYAGTGSSFFGFSSGAVYRSLDGGAT